MSTLKHKKSAKKVRWSKNKGLKRQKSQYFDTRQSKCAIFTRGNMILIKDRHSRFQTRLHQQIHKGKYDTYKGSTL